jgi:hypothetical protein
MGKGKRERGGLMGREKMQLVSEVLRRRAGCVVRCGRSVCSDGVVFYGGMERGGVGFSGHFLRILISSCRFIRTRGPPTSLYLARFCRPE